MALLQLGRSTVQLLLWCPILGALGCRTAPPPISPTEVSLQRLASYYGAFVSTQKGKGPSSEAELRSFIAKKAPGDDLDRLFRSERDGQPYVVRYGSSAKPGEVVAYEQEGRQGRRFVALSSTEVREMDESSFRTAISK